MKLNGLFEAKVDKGFKLPKDYENLPYENNKAKQHHLQQRKNILYKRNRDIANQRSENINNAQQQPWYGVRDDPDYKEFTQKQRYLTRREEMNDEQIKKITTAIRRADARNWLIIQDRTNMLVDPGNPSTSIRSFYAGGLPAGTTIPPKAEKITWVHDPKKAKQWPDTQKGSELRRTAYYALRRLFPNKTLDTNTVYC